MKAYKQPISVLVVIHTPDLQVLLLERADKAGYWQSVTGSREGEEPLLETVRREVAEETGIDTTRYRVIDWEQTNEYEIYAHWRHRYPPGTTHNTEHVFSVMLPEALPVQIAPQEHLQYGWLPWQEAAEKVFSPTNKEAILRLAEQHKL